MNNSIRRIARHAAFPGQALSRRRFLAGAVLLVLFGALLLGHAKVGSSQPADADKEADAARSPSEDTRLRLVEKLGGSKESEAAVAAALEWLARHQLPDGGWHFDLKQVPDCRGQCRHSGSAEARNAATSLALLPFLGAGQTHKAGKYQDTVRRGLHFLIERIRISPQGGSLLEPQGTMYSHGLATIALCEAYGMTHDKSLQKPAQAAIDFIVYAQDPDGGGWRYQPRQAGDTSVFGWQLSALKSGHMAYLRVPPETVKKAGEFLDSVQDNEGANYGYIKPGSGDATTAIGLLSRMYLGRKKDNPALQRGVAWLAEKGPDKNNMYYNYYATQVMYFWEGEEWTRWNKVMRDHLAETQAKEGHEAGSWSFKGHHGSQLGGRLYDTALAAMILAVRVRLGPWPRREEEDFPL